jgi:hypothetical protein
MTTARADYKVGDVVTYRLPGGGLRRVLVTARFDAGFLSGMPAPGFDGRLVRGVDEDGALRLGGAYWGYDDQIVSVEVRG